MIVILDNCGKCGKGMSEIQDVGARVVQVARSIVCQCGNVLKAQAIPEPPGTFEPQPNKLYRNIVSGQRWFCNGQEMVRVSTPTHTVYGGVPTMRFPVRKLSSTRWAEVRTE